MTTSLKSDLSASRAVELGVGVGGGVMYVCVHVCTCSGVCVLGQ